MASDRPQPLVTGSHAPGRLFTTWMTSTDGEDHAVTDEEFAAHRPEPEAVCGVVIMLAPMEAPPGPRCSRCAAFLEARATLRPLEQRLGEHRHRRAGWLYRLVHDTLSPVVPRPRAGAGHDQPEHPEAGRPGPTSGAVPPAAVRSDSAAAGPEHPVAVRSRLAAAGPQPLGAGEVASGRHRGTAPAAAGAHPVAAGAPSPAGSLPGDPADPMSPTAASALRTPSVAVVDGSTAVSGRAAALSSSPPCGRQGTQTPAGAACSPAAAPAGHHALEGDVGR